jgi:putative chitinase
MNHDKLAHEYTKQYPKTPITLVSQSGLDFLVKSLLPMITQNDVGLKQASYILATTQHEVGGTWAPIPERGPLSYFLKYETGRLGKVLGNTSAGDGYKYRGRGFCQITGKGNYEKFGKLLTLPLVEHPDLALGRDVAFRVMHMGMVFGLFTGKKLGDYINETKTDYVNSRRIINGDVALHGERIAAYAKFFQDTLTLCLTS